MMNRIGRLVVAAVVAAALVTTVVILLGDTSQTASANGQVTLTWYVDGDAAEVQWEEQMIQEFQSTHPTITVELIVASWADFAPRLNGMWLQGNPPDVWNPNGGPSGFKSDFVKNRLADLTPFINGPNPLDLDDFFTETVDMYTVDGNIYGLPIYSGGSFLFYNKDMFDEASVAYPPTDWDDPSWTWDAMVSKAVSLTKNYGEDNVQYGVTMVFFPWDAYSWLWGQDLFPSSAYQTGFASESYLDTPTATLAYQAWQDSFCTHHIHPSPDEARRLGEGPDGGWESRWVFVNQRTAMLATGVWGFWTLKDAGFDWGFAALPKGTPGAKDVVFTDPWAMSSVTQHPDEAWELIKFLVSEDAQRKYMQITNAPPVRQSLMPEWSTLFSVTMTISQVQEVYAGALTHGAESPNHLMVDYDTINTVLRNELGPLWGDCGASVTDTLTSADAQLEQTLVEIIEVNTVPTITLDMNVGGVVTTTDGVATLDFGTGVVSETTVVSVTSEEAILEAPGLASADRVINVVAAVSGTGEVLTRTNTPYTISVSYDEGALDLLTIQAVVNVSEVREDTLALYWWNPDLREWEREASSQVDTAAKVVRATPSRFGLFAVFGKYQVYLPLVIRND